MLVDEKPDNNKKHPKTAYQQWDGSVAPEFRHFMDRMMPAMSPSRCHHNKHKGMKSLSEMFTVSDKAFGLLMLLNKFDNWKAKAEEETIGKKSGCTSKRFADGQSSNKEGWNQAGLNTHNRLCKNLVKRQNKSSSLELEEKMKQENAIHCTRETDCIVLRTRKKKSLITNPCMRKN